MKDNVIDFNNVTGVTSQKVPNDKVYYNSNYDIIDKQQFNTGGQVTPVIVVLCEDRVTKAVQAFIGGSDDEDQVKLWGAKITQKHAEQVFGYRIPDYK